MEVTRASVVTFLLACPLFGAVSVLGVEAMQSSGPSPAAVPVTTELPSDDVPPVPRLAEPVAQSAAPQPERHAEPVASSPSPAVPASEPSPAAGGTEPAERGATARPSGTGGQTLPVEPAPASDPAEPPVEPAPTRPTWTQADQDAADAVCKRSGPEFYVVNTPAIGEPYDPDSTIRYPCTRDSVPPSPGLSQ